MSIVPNPNLFSKSVVCHALRASHLLALKKPLRSVLVRVLRFELRTPSVSVTCSTNWAIRAYLNSKNIPEKVNFHKFIPTQNFFVSWGEKGRCNLRTAHYLPFSTAPKSTGIDPPRRQWHHKGARPSSEVTDEGRDDHGVWEPSWLSFNSGRNH